MFKNGAEVKLIEKPQADTIHVTMNQVWCYPTLIPDQPVPDAITTTTTVEKMQSIILPQPHPKLQEVECGRISIVPKSDNGPKDG